MSEAFDTTLEGGPDAVEVFAKFTEQEAEMAEAAAAKAEGTPAESPVAAVAQLFGVTTEKAAQIVAGGAETLEEGVEEHA
jgi:hypothetical protein